MSQAADMQKDVEAWHLQSVSHCQPGPPALF